MPHDLVSLFIDAIKIDALSLKERPMANFVREFLRDLPVKMTSLITLTESAATLSASPTPATLPALRSP